MTNDKISILEATEASDVPEASPEELREALLATKKIEVLPECEAQLKEIGVSLSDVIKAMRRRAGIDN